MILTEELKKLYPMAEAELAKPLHLRDGRLLPPITAQIAEEQQIPLNSNGA